MLLQSVRDLKIQLAQKAFGPLPQGLSDRALKPKLGMAPRPSPLQRLAVGIGRGPLPGDFSLAVRLQARSPYLQGIVARSCRGFSLVRVLARERVDGLYESIGLSCP